jgi:hypothetical protein
MENNQIRTAEQKNIAFSKKFVPCRWVIWISAWVISVDLFLKDFDLKILLWLHSCGVD